MRATGPGGSFRWTVPEPRSSTLRGGGSANCSTDGAGRPCAVQSEPPGGALSGARLAITDRDACAADSPPGCTRPSSKVSSPCRSARLRRAGASQELCHRCAHESFEPCGLDHAAVEHGGDSQDGCVERAELPEGVRIDMSEFEIYARRRAVESQSQCAHELALDVAAAIGAPPPPVAQVFTARSASAAANVMSLPPGGGMVWDVFEEHPLVVDIHPPSDGAKWSSTEELARYVFSRLNETRKYELLLVYDLEEFIDSNFEFADRSRMRTYGQ